ncbi:MAG: hypothetical protein NXI22_18500 [bacterium]|nr:hypothetical protein [bacterium]
MKGATGIIVALVVGALGVVLNWVYLQNKTADYDTVSFIGIRDGETINPGDRIETQHLDRVTLPQKHAGNLKDFAVLWTSLQTVVGEYATKKYQSGDMIFLKDLRTPPPELKLEPGTDLLVLPVDTQRVIPEFINPGDNITFLVANHQSALGADPAPGANTEMIGPFIVGSVGNRLGSVDVMKGGRRAPAQQRQIGIIVKREGNAYGPQAMKLLDRLHSGDNQNIGVALHAPSK